MPEPAANQTTQKPEFKQPSTNAGETGGVLVVQPPNTTQKPEFKAAVGLSRKWDARAAGREVALNTLEKLGCNPHFVLLFATIHYEKHGGFQELLNGVWDILPENTPLIGGTVAGFINPQGCYTRGVTALAVNYSNMDIAVGIGHNTKRNPQKAAKECAKQIKQKLDKSKYKNKFIYEVVSGGKIPNFPGLGRRRIVRSGFISTIASQLSLISLKILQFGVGREEEVLDSLVSELSNYTLLGMSSIDDNMMVENYQFYYSKVVSNVVLGLGISTNLDIDLNTTYGMEVSPNKLIVSNISSDKRILHGINNKPAIHGFLEAIRWPDDFINERLYRKTFFTPLGYEKDGILFPNVLGLCLGNDIILGYKVQSPELHLLRASGKSMISAVDQNLSYFKRNSSLVLIVSCAARLEALGSNIALEGDKTIEYFNNSPFLIVFAGGEDAYSKKNGKRHVNESFNVATLS